MPTHNDETLHDRYAREHADHLARLAKLTPEQIAEMELSLHNALAEVDRLRAQAQAAPEAEPVEVVAWRGKDQDGGEGFSGAKWPDAFGSDCCVEPLMTVAQHNRIMVSAPQHDAELVELRGLRPVLAMILNALDRDAAEGKAARGEIAEELRAKLATLSAKSEGDKP